MRNPVQIYLFTIALVLTGCNASMDKYSGSGGVLHDYYSSRNYGDVVRRANIYCSSIGMGAPRISKILNGCLLICGSEYDKYNFTCESNIYNQPTIYTPAPNVSYSKNKSCDTDIDCTSGSHCRFQPNSDINVCRPSGWKSTDAPQESTAIQPPVITKPLSLQEFKTQCKELGFKVGTPDFGDCVLELNDSK